MKSVFLIVILLALAGYFYTQQKPQQRSVPAAGSAAEDQPVVKQDIKPEPQQIAQPKLSEGGAQPGQAAAKTPGPRLAPDGTFYAIQRISVVTDSGVSSVLPGAKLTLLKPGPPLHVTDGKQQFDVTPEQVTNDLDVANRAYQAHVQQQSQIASAARAPQPVPDRQAVEVARQNAAKGETDMRKAQAILELRSRLGVLARKQVAAEKVAVEIRGAIGSNGRTTYNGKHPTPYDLAMAENDCSQLNYERREIENKIAELQQ